MNSNIQFQLYYTNNKKNGSFLEFYLNGKVKTRTNYENDKIHGEYFEYFENEITIPKKICKYHRNNILEYKEYNENNQIIFHLNYLNGKRDGYCVSGKYIFFYKNDKKVCVLINEEKTYDKCCVCYYETKTQTLCEHYICKNCIQKLIDSSLLNTCPLCRKSFITNDDNNT